MTQYNWQLHCAKRCGKIYTIICFLGNEFLLGCNHNLANSLLNHELKCLGWIGLWWWWFGMVWVILISLIKMNWCGFSLISNPFAGPNVGSYLGRLEILCYGPAHRCVRLLMPAIFSFLYLKKIKISKIYVRFGKFQKYTPVAIWRGDRP